ncbi:MAG TPA: hypothetical protein VJ731_11225 [Terriglobales bacterium]|nr:hypothetical protein [Terriglobales bacterium]
MSRRKRQPEQFDVVEFLRESDGDLKSALNSLLRTPAATVDSDIPLPGLKLVPPPASHLDTQESSTELTATARSDIDSTPAVNLKPGPELTITVPGPNLTPGPNLLPKDPGSTQTGLSIPGINLIPGGDLLSPPPTVPEPTSVPSQSSGPKKRRFPIREMKLAQDAHTRAEQQVYEYLWQNARTLDEVSRSITIGFGAMARMVRLSESNARINVRSLIAKLALEEFGDYNCERSLGRTYRILNYSEILKRRREAGLLWYMRRTLAVVFVNPRTGEPVDLGLRKPGPLKSRPGPNLTGDRGANLTPEPPPKLSGEPGINLEPLYREEVREKNLRETSSSSDSLLFDALSQYGVADDDVIKRLRTQTRNICPDFTDEELIHFIHSKGQLIRRRDSNISSPIGFLLTSVPKCFAGEAFQLFRKAQKESREREALERAQREAEFENWRKEQQAILDDPNASEEDKKWARKMLSPDDTSL